MLNSTDRYPQWAMEVYNDTDTDVEMTPGEVREAMDTQSRVDIDAWLAGR